MSSSRRTFLAASGAIASAMSGPVQLAAAAAGPVRIKNVEIFPIEIPTPREELEMGKYARYTFYEVETDVGVRGWCFDRGTEYRVLDRAIRPALAMAAPRLEAWMTASASPDRDQSDFRSREHPP